VGLGVVVSVGNVVGGGAVVETDMVVGVIIGWHAVTKMTKIRKGITFFIVSSLLRKQNETFMRGRFRFIGFKVYFTRWRTSVSGPCHEVSGHVH
jgi:hypothetical protein